MTQGPYPIEILTTSQMARADSLAIAGGVPSMTLMENAAAAITRTTNQILQKSSGRRVLVLCGPGNNGGDGYVAARLLRNWRIKVKVAALTPRESLRGDALAAAAAWDGAVEPAETCSFDGTDLVVDALFGAGLARDIEGPAAELVARLNKWRRESGQHVVAVDMPSGIDGTTGAVRGVAVEADATVTFFRLKSGHLLLPGRLHCGALTCANIGIRARVLADIAPDIFVNAPGFWLEALPFPKIEGHKYSRGHALVVCGRRVIHRRGADGGGGGAAGGGRARHSRKSTGCDGDKRRRAHQRHAARGRRRGGARGIAKRCAQKCRGDGAGAWRLGGRLARRWRARLRAARPLAPSCSTPTR